jgi:hypothetical protein
MPVKEKGFSLPGTESSRRAPGGGWGKNRAGILTKLLLKMGETGAKVQTGDDNDDIMWVPEVNC